MKTKNFVIVVIVGILLVAITIFIIKIYNSPSTGQVLSNSQYIYSSNFDREDSILFNKDELKNLVPQFVIKSNFRNDIKCLKLKNVGTLYYTNIDIDTSLPMDKFIWFNEKISKISTFHPYFNFSKDNGYDFEISGEKVSKVNKVIFCLTGNGKLLQKNIYNKNFVSYYLPVSSFSIRYSEKSYNDIFFGGKQTLSGRSTFPLMISFYKIHKSLYFFILIPNENEMSIEGDTFGKLINYKAKMQLE